MANPDGYPSLPTIVGTIIFLFISMVLEIFVTINVVVASRWRLTMPDFLALGVMKEIEHAESSYQNTIVRFYHGQENNRIVTTATLIVALVSLSWSLLSSATTGYFVHILSFAAAIVTSLAMSGHLIISVVAHKKAEKWQQFSDEEIRRIVHERFQKHADIDVVVPSVAELEGLLEQARLSIFQAVRIANHLELFLQSEARRISFLAIIIGICTFLILLYTSLKTQDR